MSLASTAMAAKCSESGSKNGRVSLEKSRSSSDILL